MSPMPTSVLPPELWELIYSFLTPKDVCRLRSLNRVFFYAALKFHYSTLVIQPDDPQVRSLLKRQYVLDNVHTLYLKNYVKFPKHYFRKGDIFLSVYPLLTTRYPVAQGLKRLHNVQHLYLEFGRFAPKSFFDIIFHNLRQNLVHLDICFTYLKHFDTSWLNDSVLCPNIRSLGLSLDDTNQRYVSHAPLLERAVRKIRSLVPSNIESLTLTRQCWISNASSSISLNFFNQLKNITCSGSSYPPIFPFDIAQLVNTNIETLVAIDIECGIVVDYGQLNWSEQVHSLSLDALAFFCNRHLCLPRLARCHQLCTLKLDGIIMGSINDHFVDLDQEGYKDFHQSLLMALSGTSTLIHLEMPYLTLTFQRVWEIVSTFPNLDTLCFIGTPDEEDPETYHLLLKVDHVADPLPLSSGLTFQNLKTCLSQIRKYAVECSTSDVWQEYSEAIEEALTSCSSRYELV